MKKLKALCIMLVLCIAAGVMPGVYAGYPDVNVGDSYYEEVERLQELGIISGYEDGNFHAERDITRAEFAKVMVCAMDAETEAKAYGISSKFYDVPQGNWAVPYIAYVTSKGMVAGYPDGSFGPANTITYAEALTILGKMLGYTEEAIGSYWPTNYVNLARDTGITEGLEFSAHDPINRGIAAIIVDRALFTEMSKSASTGKSVKLIEGMGYSIIEDCYIIASKNEDESLLQNQVRTSEGTYKVTDTALLSYVGQQGTVVLNGDGEIKQFTPTELVSQTVVVNSVNGNTVEYTRTDGVKGSFKFENTFVTYLDYEKSTYARTSASIATGTELTFYGESAGAWSFAVIDEGDDITPALASHDYSDEDYYMEGIPIDYNNLTIYRDGKAASISDIKKNDVIYYNTRINTMDVYTKKVTGIYYDALPSKAYVTEVTVGGKNYKIGETAATRKLDASEGSFEIGDKVTLLLGKNDEVVFAVELTDFNYYDYGILVSSGKKIAESGENEGSSETYVEIFMPDGEIYEYPASGTYKDYIGKLVNIKYSNGMASLTLVSTASKAYGAVDYTNRTIGGKTVLKDAKIIQRISGEDSSDVQLEILNFETLEISELPEADVIASVSASKFGDIGILYVTNLEGSRTYGYLKSRIDGAGFQYNIYTSDGLETYTSDIKFGNMAGSGVSYKVENGKLTGMTKMHKIDSASSLGAVEGSRIMLNDTIYKMHSAVVVVDISNWSDYKVVSVDELADTKNITNVTIYSENSLASGGVINVVTFTKKS